MAKQKTETEKTVSETEHVHEGHRAIDLRLATIEGHIKAVRKMLQEDKYCIDIALQLLAIEKAVKKTSIELLKNHLNSCITESAGDEEKVMEQIAEYNRILEKLI